MNKAAVVMGGNRTGGLPTLAAATTGAKQMGAWLAGEGFDVRLFVDDQGPITTGTLFNEVNALVEQGTLEQLVVYFAGHGFLNNYSEYWMLSGAPQNPNEAIVVRESAELARESGIPNVVFISDACRSTLQSLQADRVDGSLVFPNAAAYANVRPEVDRFFAALPGEPSFESSVQTTAGEYGGIFTRCFLQAYKTPDPPMVRQITEAGAPRSVIPNRNLKDYLRREVPRCLQELSLRVGQLPDAIVESGDSMYIGGVGSSPPPVFDNVSEEDVSITPPPAAGPSVATGAPDFDIRLTSGFQLGPQLSRAMNTPSGRTDFESSALLVKNADSAGDRGHFETKTGFKIVGAQVTEAIAVGRHAQSFTESDRLSYVRLDPRHERDACSILIRFADGSGTVLAGLAGYIGTVTVDDGRVINVSYTPSDNSDRWDYYNTERQRVEELRSIVASASRYGAFRVDRSGASVIADQIRYAKSIDPTLGLYAAYAYSEVGLRDETRSILNYMQADIQARLFDVALLADDPILLGDHGPSSIVPFCPMLSQGWAFLRVRRTVPPVAVTEAGRHLLPALWTTFSPAGIDVLTKAIQEGSVV